MTIQNSPSNAKTTNSAVANLKNGHLVAFPTETVYGLGADAENKDAIKRLYSIKGRPDKHPVIVHIGDKQFINYWSKELPNYVDMLIESFWPGPMTLILPRSSMAKDWITGGQDAVGIRMPSHPIALELLKKFHELGGKGVAAPSANRFGGVSPTSAQAVIDELGELLGPNDLVIDGGECEIGIESTILDCTGELPKIIRKGAITEEMLLGVVEIAKTESSVRASGTLPRHYSPRTPVVINQNPIEGDGLIAFSSIATPKNVKRLAAPSTIDEFAHDLYKAFRLGDKLQVSRIVVIPPEGDGIASAIRDRINRACYQEK